MLFNGTIMASISVSSVDYASQLSRFLIEERGLTAVVVKVVQGDVFVLYYSGEEKPNMLEGFEYKEPVKSPPLANTLTDNSQEKPKLIGYTSKTPQVLLNFGSMAEASIFLACLHTKNDGPEVTLKHEYGPTNAECRTTLEIMDARHFIVCMYALLWPFIKEPTFKPK